MWIFRRTGNSARRVSCNSTINRFLDLHQDTPADAFDLLQDVLVQQNSDLNTLNQSPSTDNKSRWTTPVRKREYFEALEITPGNGLAQLIALLLDRTNVHPEQLFAVLSDMERTELWEFLNTNSLSKSTIKISQEIVDRFIEYDFIAGLSFEVCSPWFC